MRDAFPLHFVARATKRSECEDDNVLGIGSVRKCLVVVARRYDASLAGGQSPPVHLYVKKKLSRFDAVASTNEVRYFSVRERDIGF